MGLRQLSTTVTESSMQLRLCQCQHLPQSSIPRVWARLFLKLSWRNLKSVILCGIETHACITHTTLDLMEMGIDVHIPMDCVSSRSNFDRKVALERLKQSGAFLTSCEAVILGMAP